MSVGTLVRALRRELGWSQGNLAEEASRRLPLNSEHISQQSVGQFENGNVRNPRYFDALCGALRISPELLRHVADQPDLTETMLAAWRGNDAQNHAAWLSAALERTGRSFEDLVAATEVPKTLVEKFMKGEAKLSAAILMRLEKFFDIPMVVMVELIRTDREGLPLSKPGKRRSPRTIAESSPITAVRIIGHIQAGDWRESLEWPQDEQTRTVPINDNRFDPKTLFGLEVRGDSMNQEYHERDILVCRRFDPTSELPPIGKRVVVQRHDSNGLVEATVKALEVDDFGVGWLAPKSSNPIHESIKFNDGDNDGDHEIIGVVVLSYRPH